MNGCPNSCGQHPIGKISFYGLARKVAGRPVPFYRVLLGGRAEAEKTVLAKEIGMVPARNVPKFLEEFLKKINENIGVNEDVYEFIEAKAAGLALPLLKDHSYVPSYSEDKTFYIDWGADKEFSLEGIGPGECGAGVIDIIESDLAEAAIALKEDPKKSLFLSARALLIVKGHEPKTPEEAFRIFKSEFIDKGLALPLLTNPEKFLDHVKEIYKNMDSSFNFAKIDTIKGDGAKKARTDRKAVRFLDLKGVACPINYVKIKLFMEEMRPSEELEVLLDEGEPMENVPKSVENDGHKILNIEKTGGVYKVLIRKGAN